MPRTPVCHDCRYAESVRLTVAAEDGRALRIEARCFRLGFLIGDPRHTGCPQFAPLHLEPLRQQSPGIHRVGAE